MGSGAVAFLMSIYSVFFVIMSDTHDCYYNTDHSHDDTDNPDNNTQCSIQSVIIIPVLNILSVCKAEEGSGVIPPLTDDNAADGKIGSAGTMITGWMEYWHHLFLSFLFSTYVSPPEIREALKMYSFRRKVNRLPFWQHPTLY